MYILLALILTLLVLPGAEAQTRLGLFHTAEEVVIWRQRAGITAGTPKFKTTGDFSARSPGDWDRIVANATNFRNNPSQDRVQGQPANTCIGKNDPGQPGGTNPAPSTAGWRIADAAFYYIVTGHAATESAIRAELLVQAAIPGVNFWDEKRFCRTGATYTEWGASYIEWPLWITKYVLAYDAVKHLMTSGQRTTMDNWFRGAGYWLDTATITRGGIRDDFPNRDTATVDADYGTPAKGPRALNPPPLYWGGPTNRRFHGEIATNTKTSAMVPVGLIAIVVNDAFLKKSAKQYVKEFLMFSTWPQGAITDFRRGGDNNYAKPCKGGMDYSIRMLSDMIIIADAFARNGDTELYDYTTTHGFYGSEGVDQLSGQPKSLRRSIDFMAAYIDKTFNRYMTDVAGNVGNQFYRIYPVCGNGSGPYVGDIDFSIANNYYKSTNIRNVYLRTKANTPAWPATPSGNPWVWAGNHGILSGILFRFGDMHTLVTPYPTSTDTDTDTGTDTDTDTDTDTSTDTDVDVEPPIDVTYGTTNEACQTTQQAGTGGLIVHNNTATLQTVVEGNNNRTILVRAGTYNVNNFNVATNTIVKPYDCESVTVNVNGIIDMTNAGFTVAGLRFNCVTNDKCLRMSGASNSVFRNNRVSNAGDAAFVVRVTSANNLIEGNDISGACGNVRIGDWIKFTEGITGIVFRRNRAQLCSTNTNQTGNDMISINALTQSSLTGPAVLITENLFGSFYNVEQAFDAKRNVIPNAYFELSYNTFIGPHFGHGNGSTEAGYAVNIGDYVAGLRDCVSLQDCPRHRVHHNYIVDSWSSTAATGSIRNAAIGIKLGGATRPSSLLTEFNIDHNAQNSTAYNQTMGGVTNTIYRHNSHYRASMRLSDLVCTQTGAGGNPNLTFSNNIFEETRITDSCTSGGPGTRWLITNNVWDAMPATIQAGNQDAGNVTANIAYGSLSKQTPDFTVLGGTHSQKGALPVPTIVSAAIDNACTLRVTMAPYDDIYNHGPISKADRSKMTIRYNGTAQPGVLESVNQNIVRVKMNACPLAAQTVTLDTTHGWCEDSANIGGPATQMNAKCLAVTGQAVTNLADEGPPPEGEQTFYIDNSCGTNGNGTTETCGASGPWNSLEAAVVTANCAGMKSGDTLEIKGGTTYYETENLSPGVGCSNITIKSADNEDVAFDGSVDIKAQTWTSIGSGVYESHYDFGEDEFPFTAKYDRGAGEERLTLIQSVRTCTTSLAAGTMRYNPTTNRVCVRLSNGSNPASASYVRIPQQEAFIRLQGSEVDGLTLTVGTNSTFTVTDYAERGITGHHGINNDITIDGLNIGWMYDSCVSFTEGPGQNALRVLNSTIHHCGNYGVRSTGDMGGGQIVGNTITDIQTAPTFEKCAGVGASCLGTLWGDGAAIRLLNRDGIGYSIADNTILRVGGGNTGRAYGIWLNKWAQNNRVERNYIAHASGLADRGYGIYTNLDATNEFINNNRYFNNRIYNVDVGFAQNIATNISPQAGTQDRFMHNTIVGPHDYGMLAEGDGPQTRAVAVQNNLFAAYTTSPMFFSTRPNDTGWNTFIHNLIYCDSCVTDQILINHQGTTVRRANNCSAGTDCLADFNASSTLRRNNVEGNPQLNLTGDNPTLHIVDTSEAFDAATTLAANAEFPNEDCCGNPRPLSTGNDIGAHETDTGGDPEPPGGLSQTAYQFYGQFLREGEGGIGLNMPARIYGRGATTLRIELTAIAGSAPSQGVRLQSRLCNPDCGAWTLTTQDDDDATGIYLVAHPFRTDGEPTNARYIASNPSGAYMPGQFRSIAEGVMVGLNQDQSTELEYSLKVSSVPDVGDVIQLRLLDDAQAITYNQTPMVIIVRGRQDSAGGARE